MKSNIKPGQKFGKWTVVRNAGTKITGDYITAEGKWKMKIRRSYICRCECGKRISVLATNLLSGDSTQCVNCFRVTIRKPYHKLSRERLRQMKKNHLGLCKRSCDGKLFKSGYCEKHYEEFLLYAKNRYQAKKQLTNA